VLDRMSYDLLEKKNYNDRVSLHACFM